MIFHGDNLQKLYNFTIHLNRWHLSGFPNGEAYQSAKTELTFINKKAINENRKGTEPAI